MVIITQYELLGTDIDGVFVRSAECLPCPCCQGALELFGRRRRSQILGSGEKRWLLIRRMHCADCSKIHHELPDVLVPYKRHEAQSIEQVIENRKSASVSADESTLNRWRAWFAWWAPYACGCLEALRQRFSLYVEASSGPIPVCTPWPWTVCWQCGRMAGQNGPAHGQRSFVRNNPFGVDVHVDRR